MPLTSHIAKHYNQVAGAKSCGHSHRDNLMVRHNAIKRGIIATASQCASADGALSGDEIRRILASHFQNIAPAKSPKGGVRNRKRHYAESCTHKPVRVLDLGSGRGGDLLKWQHANAGEYVGVDVSYESCEEALRRAAFCRGMKTKILNNSVAEFFATEQEHCLAPVGTFNVISLQFVLNYVVDSHRALAQFFESCVQCLRPGGVIVGTTVDDAVAREYMDARDHSDYFSLSSVPGQEMSSSDIGYMYQFYLHNCVFSCIECIVPWRAIHDAAASAGLQLDYMAGFASPVLDTGDSETLHDAQKKLTRLYVAFQFSHPERRKDR